MSTKSSKMFNNVLFYMSSIEKFQFLTFFNEFQIFGKIEDGAQYGGHVE